MFMKREPEADKKGGSGPVGWVWGWVGVWGVGVGGWGRGGGESIFFTSREPGQAGVGYGRVALVAHL